MATDARTLSLAAACYLCCGVTQVEAVKLALLAQISVAKNSSNKTDPTSLMAQAKGFQGVGDISNYDLLELALLVQLAS